MDSSASNELGNILNQENLIIEQVTSILRVAQKQDVRNLIFLLRDSIRDFDQKLLSI